MKRIEKGANEGILKFSLVDCKNELLQIMLQVSDPQSLGIVPNQALSYILNYMMRLGNIFLSFRFFSYMPYLVIRWLFPINANNTVNAHFGHASFIDSHTVLCESCEQPTLHGKFTIYLNFIVLLILIYFAEDDKFILGKSILLPGPQDKNYVFTCRTCSSDGVPTMVHKVKNRYQ